MSSINEQAKKDVKESKEREDRAIKLGDASGGRTGREDIETEDTEVRFLFVLLLKIAYSCLGKLCDVLRELQGSTPRRRRGKL